LRCLVKQLERGEVSLIDLKKNLEYAASVLESVYIEETRLLGSRLVDVRRDEAVQADLIEKDANWRESFHKRGQGPRKDFPEMMFVGELGLKSAARSSQGSCGSDVFRAQFPRRFLFLSLCCTGVEYVFQMTEPG
ncbi:calcium/calmodulin-dependent 3',5'-cyclic nucleotide phosphodiesterase 1A isoform X1, partial [Tachysurus ichikawai]